MSWWFTSFERTVLQQLARLQQDQQILARSILRLEEKFMTALSDLQAAVTDLTNTVTDAVSEIETLLTKITTPGVPTADVQAAAASIAAITQGIKDEVAKAKAAAP